MSKWPLRFGGGPKDLPVMEFIFRTETLARLSGLPQAALTLGLHQILAGSAASWYWIFIRNNPNATWAQTRTAIIRAFQTSVSDAAIRRLIMDRLQRPSERFMEFLLSIQELEARLVTRMDEPELLDTLRRNMLPHIQDKLLFIPIHSVYDLQSRVNQVEELAQQQLEVLPLRRPVPRIHEIATNPSLCDSFHSNHHFMVPPPPFGMVDLRPNPFAEQEFHPDQSYQQVDQSNYLCAIGSAQDRNRLACWNCDEVGHTYMDCASQRTIFCYGCGAKNVIRPQCPKCSIRALQGNGRGSVRPVGNPHGLARPSGHPPHTTDILRRPQ